MKKTIIFCCVLISSILSIGQGLEGIVVERYYVSDQADSINSDGILPVGSIAYRIYVDLAPDYKLLAVYGTPEHHLFLQTTTAFFNNEFFGSMTPNFSKGVLGFNSMMLDSWVSMGAACTGYCGVLKTEDDGIGTVMNMNGMMQNNDTLAGIPVSVQDGMIQATPATITMLGLDNALAVLNDVSQVGNLVYVSDGVWASLGGARGPLPSNRILIAQLTTDGVLSFELNIQIQDTLTLAEYRYVAQNPTGNEILYPGLIFSSNLPPHVEITSPSNAANFIMGDTVTIEASASDIDGSVDQVDFYVDGNNIGSDTSSPFSYDYISTDGSHSIYCIAYDDQGDSAVSAAISINVTTGVEENDFPGQLLLYPNPFTDIIYLSLTPLQASDLTIRIIDLNGRLMHSTSMPVSVEGFNTEFDLSGQSPGIYFLELSLGAHKRSLQIIKQ